MDPGLARRLADITGPRTVVARTGVVTPREAGQVAAVCAACAEAEARMAVTSSPVEAAPGAAGTSTTGVVVISLSRLVAIEVSVARMVARVEAGATVAGVCAALGTSGLAIAGTDLAAVTPQDRRFGAFVASGGLPRRSLCGVEAVLAGGETVSAGGAIHRDVAGYDLVGALLGSEGRLALIVAVTLRLEPATARADALEAAGAARPGDLSDQIRGAFDPAGLLVGAS